MSNQAKQDSQPRETAPKEPIIRGVLGVSKHQAKETKESAEQKEQQDKQQQLRELTSTLQHLQADFENYKKRVARDQEEHRQFAKKELLLNLLPIIDAFELALQDLAKEAKDKEKEEQECKTSSARKGLELIYTQLHTLLEKEGVQKIDSLHQLYNPLLHEAIMTEKAAQGKKDMVNTVIEEFQAGYAMHGRVLRPAKVKIAIG